MHFLCTCGPWLVVVCFFQTNRRIMALWHCLTPCPKLALQYIARCTELLLPLIVQYPSAEKAIEKVVTSTNSLPLLPFSLSLSRIIYACVRGRRRGRRGCGFVDVTTSAEATTPRWLCAKAVLSNVLYCQMLGKGVEQTATDCSLGRNL